MADRTRQRKMNKLYQILLTFIGAEKFYILVFFLITKEEFNKNYLLHGNIFLFP